ncbi:VanZ family protein [Bacteroidota bacterium]|nr:VanZ family protein [Bacteroidota bacterium]
MARYKFTYLAFSFTLLITFFSVIPLQIKIAGDHNFLNLDKAIHFLIYFIYTISIFISLEKEFPIMSSKLLSIFISFIVGFSLELIQGFFLAHRSFEILDLFSNCAGILTFALVSKTIKKVVA